MKCWHCLGDRTSTTQMGTDKWWPGVCWILWGKAALMKKIVLLVWKELADLMIQNLLREQSWRNKRHILYCFVKRLNTICFFQILPIVVRTILKIRIIFPDRKTGQAALLALLEQKLIKWSDVETKVCSVLIELIVLPRATTTGWQRLWLYVWCSYGWKGDYRASYPPFHEIRCDCRMFEKSVLPILNIFERELASKLPRKCKFFRLFSDILWGVRKAYAECFMTISCITCWEIQGIKLLALLWWLNSP